MSLLLKIFFRFYKRATVTFGSDMVTINVTGYAGSGQTVTFEITTSLDRRKTLQPQSERALVIVYRFYLEKVKHYVTTDTAKNDS